jgi:hypothetical protein
MEAELPDRAELIAQSDRFTPGDAFAPTCDGLVERHLPMLAPLPGDKAHESLKIPLPPSIRSAHGALETEKRLNVASQLGGSDYRGHVGTGSEISRRESVAIRT